MAIPFTSLLCVALLFFCIIIVISASEADILLDFKSFLNDGSISLSAWLNTSKAHFCSWTGITCTSHSPPSVASLSLQFFNLSGEIPSSICHLPYLASLNLANNFFNQSIPLHLSLCVSLRSLNLSNNLLWGTVPDQLSELTSLVELDLSSNRLEGRIPLGLSFLKRLRVLNLAKNSFSGSVPSVFGNLTELILLDLSENPYLTSEIPNDIGRLTKLRKLSIQNSGISGGIPDSFAGLSELVAVDMSQNNLTGSIPSVVGPGLQKIVSFDVSQNRLSGVFPDGICSGQGLKDLSLHTNSFSRMIPDSMQACRNLERFQIQNNGFSGILPLGIWSLPKIKLLRLENNKFQGGIPDSVSRALQLEQIRIDNNNFIGNIPEGFGKMKSLYKFSASLNGLYGRLPQDFCSSPVLSILNLSHNFLSGPIPKLSECRKLVSLSLADNNLTGNIPSSLADLPVLTYIDLSMNNLTGEIPHELQNLKLALFNVSFNRLSGSVPLSLISGLPSSSLQGNPDLCGPGLPFSCVTVHRKRSLQRTGLIYGLVVIVMAAIFSMVLIFSLVLCRASRQRDYPNCLKTVLFYPGHLTEHDLAKGFADKNPIEHGAFGAVYLVSLPGSKTVVVKKLINAKTLSTKTLRAEVKSLSEARHKNIAKLLGFCYSGDVILVIYENFPKGSLKEVISKRDFSLEWDLRLKIAIGVARGLAYLHCDYLRHLLHMNLQTRNILLDTDYEPKLTEFGLNRIIGESVHQFAIVNEAGSHICVAPEHGCNRKATEQIDIYSFGIVLLELITGWPGAFPEHDEPVDIVTWVRRKINMENGCLKILDPRISLSAQEGMVEALDIAIGCISVMPARRPNVLEVIRSLEAIEGKCSL